MTIPEVATTTAEERELLSRLAKAVPADGLILEIGCLYGGTTEVLSKAAPKAKITSVDIFDWTPDGYPTSTADLFRENMKSVDAKNVTLIEGDSREVGKRWNEPIDLLFVDGGHSYEFIYSDLFYFGKFADVIALHDYKNPSWQSIEKAIETFIAKDRIWKIAEVVGMVCVLRKI